MCPHQATGGELYSRIAQSCARLTGQTSGLPQKQSYGARLIPVGQFPQRRNDINPADDIVVHCQVGGRSAQAYEVLKQAGYTRIKNLKGGILAWADQVDRSMQKY